MPGILIVDDSMVMRGMLRDIVSAKYPVAGEAGDGDEAIEQYKALKPDLVILDITMPKRDGISALQEIVRMDPQAKVVIVSAVGQKAYIEQAVGLGAKGYIVKPFSPEKVLETIDRLMG
ncbi:MAG: response regulator [bacterium]